MNDELGEVPADKLTHTVKAATANADASVEPASEVDTELGEVPADKIVQGTAGVGGQSFHKEKPMWGGAAAAIGVGVPLAKLTGEATAARDAWKFFKGAKGKAAPIIDKFMNQTPAEKWNQKMHGVEMPHAEMNKGSFDIGQQMKGVVGPGGELQGGSIHGGIMVGPEATRQIEADRAAAINAERDAETMRQANQTVRDRVKAKMGAASPVGSYLANKALTAGKQIGGSFGAGYNATDLYNRAMQGEIPQAAVSTAGLAGSVANMLPGKKLNRAGAITAIGAPIVNKIIDVAQGHAAGGAIKPVTAKIASPNLLMQSIKAVNQIKGPVAHMKRGGKTADELLDYFMRSNVGVKTQARRDREAQFVHDIVPTHLFGAPKHIGIQDLQKEKAVLVPVAGDRTLTGHKLRAVNQVPLRNEVELQGGPFYGQKENELGRPGFWASNDGTASGFQNMLGRGADRYGDRPFYGLYGAMDYDAGNFAKHNTRALYEQIDAMNPTKAQVSAFDEHMRKQYPGWAGVKDEDALNQLLGSVPMRKFFAETLNKPTKAAEFGMPSGEATMHAITEPGLRDVPVGNMGFSVGKLDPRAKAMDVPTYNETYNMKIPGEAVGQMKAPLHWSDYFPDPHKQIMSNPRQAGSAWGTFKMGDYYQPVTQEIVDKIAPIEEAIEKHGNIIMPGQAGWFKEGGKVAEHKLAGGLGMLPQAARTGMRNVGTSIDEWNALSPEEKARRMGKTALSGAELAASFHPAYALGYGGAAAADALGTGNYGGAAMDVALNAPGMFKPIARGIRAVAPQIRNAASAVAPYAAGAGGLGALAAPQAVGADTYSDQNSVMQGYVPHMAGGGDVVKSLIKKALGSGEGVAARTIEGSPHTYPPIAEGQWMREYQPSTVGTGLPTTPEEWDALAQARQAAQNKVDYSMGNTGPVKPPLVQYMGKYRQGTPEERAAQRQSDNDTIRMLMKLRGME